MLSCLSPGCVSPGCLVIKHDYRPQQCVKSKTTSRGRVVGKVVEPGNKGHKPALFCSLVYGEASGYHESRVLNECFAKQSKMWTLKNAHQSMPSRTVALNKHGGNCRHIVPTHTGPTKTTLLWTSRQAYNTWACNSLQFSGLQFSVEISMYLRNQPVGSTIPQGATFFDFKTAPSWINLSPRVSRGKGHRTW